MTNAMLVTPLYKALSSDISDLAFHVIRDKGNLDELKERLGVFKVPSVMVLQPNEDKPTFFDGMPDECPLTGRMLKQSGLDYR